MISQLTGIITLKDPEFLILNVNGVGYKIFVTPDTLSKTKDEQAMFWTYLSVRENALDLYGFLTQNDMNFFALLLSVSGVGPKSALAFLALADADTLSTAISSNDINYLTKVSGIGKKSAQKIVLELKDKVGSTNGKALPQEDTDAVDALIAMGYSSQEARDAIKNTDNSIASAEKIKQALKNLDTK